MSEAARFTLAEKREFATQLRNNPTASEALLRDALTRKGYKFKFQPVLSGFIPDFYFPHQRKIVELDGRQFHNLERDKFRDRVFQDKGIATFRIRSHRVFTELRKVIRSIEAFLNDAPQPRRKRKSKRVKKTKRCSPAWAKVPRLGKDHLPIRRKA